MFSYSSLNPLSLLSFPYNNSFCFWTSFPPIPFHPAKTYSFTAPAVIPAIRYFCITTNTARVGTLEIMAAHIK